MKRFFSVAVYVAILAWATAAHAQVSITGGIAGTVLDSTDALVPGATVTVVDLGTGGKAAHRVYTCDLSREYIAINADYHT